MLSLGPFHHFPPVNTLSHPPSKINSNTCLSSYSRTRQLVIPKRSSIIAPTHVTLGDDGISVDEGPGEPFPEELVAERMPKHVAVTIDGHGRWAKLRGLPPSAGHQAAVEPMRRLVRLCCSWGIEILTIYIFSIENWSRPKVEVDYMMKLFDISINSSIECMKKEGIRMYVMGDSWKLPEYLQRTIVKAEENTKHNSRLQLTLALNYGGRYDVVEACKSVAKKVKDGLIHLDDINENIIKEELKTNHIEVPYPDLLIRAGGEHRLSNFMLWQLAYTELYFSKTFWPDFGKDDFIDALRSYQQRKRRYGGRQS